MKYEIKRHNDYFRMEELPDPKFYLDILNEDMPCTGCVHAQKCGDKKLACFAFAMYVNNGSVDWTIPRLPSRRTYNRVMFQENSGLTREVNNYAKEHSKL